LQETWISTLRGIRRLHTPAALLPYLYRTARNHALVHLRRQRRLAELMCDVADVSPSAYTDESAEVAHFAAETAGAVRDALDHLPLPHREALTLFFLQDLSIGEVAELLDIPPGTVKSRLHHAKRALRVILDKKGVGCEDR